MLEIIILITSSIGLVNIILFSPIMSHFRDLLVNLFSKFGHKKLGEYFISCPTCTGLWVGIMMTVLYMNGLILFTLPFTVSLFCYLAGVYIFPA